VAVVLAALLCLPYLLREQPAPVRTLLVAWGLLMALFPIVLAYGFSTVEVAGR
jgi:hypothetical protein